MLPKSPELELYHRMQINEIPGPTPFLEEGKALYRACSLLIIRTTDKPLQMFKIRKDKGLTLNAKTGK